MSNYLGLVLPISMMVLLNICNSSKFHSMVHRIETCICKYTEIAYS